MPKKKPRPQVHERVTDPVLIEYLEKHGQMEHGTIPEAFKDGGTWWGTKVSMAALRRRIELGNADTSGAGNG